MRITFILIIGLHGFFHLIGFIKAFHLANFKTLTQSISKSFGILWLLAFMLFIATVMFFIAKNNYWWLLACMAVSISQILIAYFWEDAKFGTIANVIIMSVVLVTYVNYNSEQIEMQF
jgi:hypothetical protein